MSFARMAAEIWFSGVCNPASHKLVYRAGKTIEDVKKAVQKARDPKNGRAKTEIELSMLETYLAGIFKNAT